MIFVGWIYGFPEDRELLKRLGCKGGMIYNEDEMCFEHCELSFWQVISIWLLWPHKFYPGAFTNKKGNTRDVWQPFW